MAYKKQLKDKNGNTIYPDVGLNLDDVVYSDDPESVGDDYIDPASYSETEHKTGGTWIDGKPIYRKVFSGTASTANMSIPIGENDIDKFIFIDAYRVVVGTNSDTIGQFYSTASDFFKFWCRETSNNVFQVELRSPVANYDYTIIIEYTKTTD